MIEKIYDKILPISILFYVLLFFLSWPYYKYIFDTDGVGYLSIAEQYASGYIHEAINGFWSPLHSWLVIPFIKTGISSIDSFKFSNAIIATGILCLFHFQLQRYQFSKIVHVFLMFTALIILLHYTWYELAADLLVVFFLFLYIYLVTSENFFSSWKKNIFAGFVAAFAYFAKTYTFPYLIFHFSFLHLWLNKGNIKWKFFLSGLGIFLSISFFWIYILYTKYCYWFFGSSGLLNANWFLNKTPLLNTDLVFLPPPHRFAFSAWEDPWHNSPVQNSGIFIFNSWQTWLHIIRMLLFNFQQWLYNLFQFSFLAPAIIFFILINFFYKRTYQSYIYLLLFLGYSTGYIVLHTEPRYLWIFSFFLLIAGIEIINNYVPFIWKLSKIYQILFLIIYFGSFLIEPVNQLKDNFGRQKDLHDLARNLKKVDFRDSFASNSNIDECMIIGYLNKVKYFSPVHQKNDPFFYLQSAKKQGISNFLFFYDNNLEKTAILSNPILKTVEKVTEINKGIIWIKF